MNTSGDFVQDNKSLHQE